MDCTTATSNINRFLDDEMYIKELKDFIHHVEHCKECYEELEVRYMVRYTAVALENDDSITYDFTKLVPRLLAKRKKKIKKQETQVMLILLAVIIVVAFIICYFLFLKDLIPGFIDGFKAWFQSILV